MLTNAEVTRLLDVANAGINKGQIALARTVYEGILAGRPDHAPTLISLALSHIAVSDFDDADALVYLGLSAKLAGRADEAAEILGRVPAGTTAGELAARLLEG